MAYRQGQRLALGLWRNSAPRAAAQQQRGFAEAAKAASTEGYVTQVQLGSELDPGLCWQLAGEEADLAAWRDADLCSRDGGHSDLLAALWSSSAPASRVISPRS